MKRPNAKPTLLTGLCAVAWTATPALADAPPGNGLDRLPFTCNGEEVIVTVSHGASNWVDGEHNLLASLTITFTPTGGEPRVVYDKTWGNRKGLGDEQVECSTGLARVNGALTIDGASVAVP